MTEIQENTHQGTYLKKLHFCNTFRENTTALMNIGLAEKQL